MNTNKKRPRGRSTRAGNQRALWAVVGGIIVAVAGYIVLAGNVADAFCKVFPDACPSPSSPIAVEVHSTSVERDVSLQEYLERKQQPTADYNTVQLASNGMVITVDIGLTGLKGRTCEIRTSMHVSGTNTLAPPEWFRRGVPRPKPTFTPKLDKDTWLFEYWNPYPKAEDDYYARLELWYKDKSEAWRPLKYMDTNAVRVSFLPDGIPPPPKVAYPPDKQYPELKDIPTPAGDYQP